MKYTHYFTLIIFILSGSIDCRKVEDGASDEGGKNLSVDSYITQLRSESYKSWELPAFDPGDIPSLLKYCSDTRLIHNFPVNPISSLRGPDCRLGMYILWTIESIRVMSIDSGHHPGRFPSQNPILWDSKMLALVYDDPSHQIAIAAYFDWWRSNTDFEKIKNIDPLEKTDYRWH